jgi:murein L,D-transpeptidase YcbB/YkuD
MKSCLDSLRRALPVLCATLLIASSPAALAAEAPPMPWVKDGELTFQARRLLDAMRHAETFGLSPRDFAGSVQAIESHPRGQELASLDQAITAAATRFLRQLHDGRVPPADAGYVLQRRRAALDVPAALREIASAPDVPQALAQAEPRAAQYGALKQALARYRLIQADPDSLPAPATRRLEAGDSYAGSEQLRRLLVEWGDSGAIAADVALQGIYDADLAAAITRFQRRHGMTPDGVLGPRTFAALTVPLARRIRQIELTMERWRWMPEFTPPAVIVNVPQFLLYALPDPADPLAADGPLKIAVIVGESAKQTPVFDSTIESVVIRPYWNVPASIVREEILPAIRRQPDYLARHDMEIVRGEGDDAAILPADAAALAALRAGKARLRQRPGATNALGLIKFLLPNPYSVYLHSTPEAQLFARERRALSHGCIRVSDATALAAYLLKGNGEGWDVSAIEAATCGTETFTIRLARPVPIFIVYGTVVVDSNGELLFFDDVYGYDATLEKLLQR